MKMPKRIITFLFAAIMTFELAACFSQQTYQPNPTNDNEPSNLGTTAPTVNTGTALSPNSSEVVQRPFEAVEIESDYEEASFAFVGKPNELCLGVKNTAKLKLGYKSLQTQPQRDLYEQLTENIYYISKEVNSNSCHYIRQVSLSNCTFTESELRIVMRAFIEDHPQIFWIANMFGYSVKGTTTTLQLYSGYDPEEILSMTAELNACIEELANSIPFGLDDYSREDAIHTALLNLCSYENGVSSPEDDFDAFGVYGALVKRKAVCEGYAKAFQWLLSMAGIESVCVIGNGMEALHMWNAVKISGEWYYVDPTWNDRGPYSRYDYFNITTIELIKDGRTIAPTFTKLSDTTICGNNGEEPAPFNVFVPVCTESKNSYAKRGAVMLRGFSDYDENLVVQSLYRAIDMQKPFIEIQIEVEDMPYHEVVDELVKSQGGKLFDYIHSANKMYFGRKIDEGKISIIKKESKNILTVILNYQ